MWLIFVIEFIFVAKTEATLVGLASVTERRKLFALVPALIPHFCGREKKVICVGLDS